MEDYFYPKHYMSVGLNTHLDEFNPGGLPLGITVDVMWGIDGINKTGVDFFNASQIGTPIWDEEFDITLDNNQNETYNLCQHLKTLEILYDEGMVVCWIDDFKAWLESKR